MILPEKGNSKAGTHLPESRPCIAIFLENACNFYRFLDVPGSAHPAPTHIVYHILPQKYTMNFNVFFFGAYRIFMKWE